jgi:cyclic pyranopterin phosphate synthase
VTRARDRRRLGFITPLTHNFCESCNRVRLTCTGTLYMCLGQDDAADLRTPLRASPSDEPARRPRSTRRSRASRRAMISSSTAAMPPAVARHMSLTGG